MKNKKIYIISLLYVFCFSLLNFPRLAVAQTNGYISDSSVDNIHFLTRQTSEGTLRVSTPYRDNISANDNYDGKPPYTSPNTPRYIFNDSIRYNVFGENLSSLLCRSVQNNAANTIYLSGTERSIQENNQTEWLSFLTNIGQNHGIDVQRCYCTDIQSRYQLQTGDFCGHDYCLNTSCVNNTQSNYPASFTENQNGCLPDTGHHLFACTNDLCAYPDGLQQVPGRNTLTRSGSASAAANINQVHSNRQKAFCEQCFYVRLPTPQAGQNQISVTIKRDDFLPKLPTGYLYKISTVTSSSQSNVMAFQGLRRSIAVHQKGLRRAPIFFVTVCFRYQPPNPYNASLDCTKNATCFN